MSRPIQSVPKGCESDGARLFAAKSVAWAAGCSPRPAMITTASSTAPAAAKATERLRLGSRPVRGAESTGASQMSTAAFREIRVIDAPLRRGKGPRLAALAPNGRGPSAACGGLPGRR